MADIHKLVRRVFEYAFIQGRPGAQAFVSTWRDCFKAIDAEQHICEVIKKQMVLPYIQGLLCGGSPKLEFGASGNIRMICMNPHDYGLSTRVSLEDTIWCTDTNARRSSGPRVIAYVQEFLESLSDSPHDQLLVLQCLTGFSIPPINGVDLKICWKPAGKHSFESTSTFNQELFDEDCQRLSGIASDDVMYGYLRISTCDSALFVPAFPGVWHSPQS
jgi:hypothetical protein